MLESNLSQKIDDVVAYIKTKLKTPPQIGLILGSGLGEIAKEMHDQVIIPYANLPHLPISTAPGHLGNLVLGQIEGKSFITMQGRFHLYEGYNSQISTLLIRAMKKLGVETLIITCAVGGLNENFQAGEIMVITDHINFTGTNPLLGQNLNDFGPRFPVMFDIYTPKLQQLAHQAALNQDMRLNDGVYAGILGPTYATRAELSFLIENKCDAIGMSVVQEAITAAHSNMQILGLAAITDMALPHSTYHATAEEVIESGKRITTKFKQLLKEIARRL